MLNKNLIRHIEVAREKLNNTMGSYEELEDKEAITRLSENLDELITKYMQIIK